MREAVDERQYTASLALTFDVVYQQRSQRAAPGLQLVRPHGLFVLTVRERGGGRQRQRELE